MELAHLLLISSAFASIIDAMMTNFDTINWKLSTRQRDIDFSIVNTTTRSKSILHCLFRCSNQPVEKRMSLYYIQETDMCYCNSVLDARPENTSASIVLYGTVDMPSDCKTWYELGNTEDGVYSIIDWLGSMLPVECDMTNGGWTIIQTRFDGSVDFYRDWSSYRSWFGSVDGEYWIGLDNIHHLTKAASELSVYVEAHPGVIPPSASAHYSSFSIGDNSSQYVLNVGGYTGTCGDSLAYHNGMKFSTLDMDNDQRADSCAQVYHGAWWYKFCQHANLNGKYYQQGEPPVGDKGLYWYSCWYFTHSAKVTMLKVRRN